jgi:hypothetical protein
MLECLLLGYLSATPQKNLDLETIKNSLKYLDTSMISSNLIQKLSRYGLYNSSLFLIKNPNCCQFMTNEKRDIINALGKYD